MSKTLAATIYKKLIMPQYHPIALLHAITVDSYYRIRSKTVNSWKNNMNNFALQKKTLFTWRLIHQANSYLKDTIAELTRVMNVHPHASPQVAKNLSNRN